MPTAQKRPQPAEVVSDPRIMSGMPVIAGTRVPADTILACLRAGQSTREIFEDYPSLPIDGIEAATAWAARTYGQDWMNASASHQL
jgi:uncharacterized protein (DUF433 family)